MSSNMIVSHDFSMLKFTPVLLLVLDVEFVTSGSYLGLVCRPGSYLHTPRIGPDVCLPCREGETFISEDLHTRRECNRCTQIVDNEKEVLVTRCNKTHNSEILCQHGFYRRRARNSLETDTCVVCSTCIVTTRPCQGYFDSVCCGHPDYEAVWDQRGFFICKEKPIRCGSGQYLRTSTEQCTPCPANTYRPETDHNHTECLPCLDTDQDSINNRLVLQACSTSHPALFGCKPGYFRHASVEDWLLSEDDCRPCQTCQFVGRDCDRHHNTVCCPRSGMLVSDTPQGPVCLTQEDHALATTTAGYEAMELVWDAVTCREGEFLQTDSKNKNNSSHNQMYCTKCPAGTYNTEANHTRTTCRNCSDLHDPRLPDVCSLLKDRKPMDEAQNILSIFLLEFVCVTGVSVLHLTVLCFAKGHKSKLEHRCTTFVVHPFVLSRISYIFLFIVLVLRFCMRTSNLGSKIAVLVLSFLVSITHIFFLCQIIKRCKKVKMEQDMQTLCHSPSLDGDTIKKTIIIRKTFAKQNNNENFNLLKKTEIRLSTSPPNFSDKRVAWFLTTY